MLSVDIRKKYEDFSYDVSFNCNSKRIGILGASGCGKTLTLMSIAGLIRPDEGHIVSDKRVLFDHDKGIDIRPQKRGVGYLFQDYALFPNMTVIQNVEAALKGAQKGERIKRKQNAEDILKAFGLWDVRYHRPAQLSGGQKQRTALARMLATDPALLLLDEPFSAMDTFLREGMRLELIKRLDAYDRTVVIVSHDRDEIYQMCDYLILMDKGRVVECGMTDEVFANPATLAGARLTGCKNISRIERVASHRIQALDWGGVELATDQEVTEDVRYAGIRAHDLVPGQLGENTIPTKGATVSRLPFEWYVTLGNGLWWKLPRDLDGKYTDDLIPEYVSVSPDKIILIKD